MNDITIPCRARRTRNNSPSPMNDLSHVPSHAMILTLSHWLQTDEPLATSSEFSYTITSGPEILLTPLDAMMPSPQKHPRCRSTTMNLFSTMESCRIPVHDISTVTFDDGNNNPRQLTLTTRTGTRWEIRCETRNAHDLLAACLQRHVPCEEEPPTLAASSSDSIATNSTTSSCTNRHTQNHTQNHLPSPSSSADDWDSIDDLTARCIQQSAAQESLAQKVERRWGKAVQDIQGIVSRLTLPLRSKTGSLKQEQIFHRKSAQESTPNVSILSHEYDARALQRLSHGSSLSSFHHDQLSPLASVTMNASTQRIVMLLRPQRARIYRSDKVVHGLHRPFSSFSTRMPTSPRSRSWYGLLAVLSTFVWIRDSFVDIVRVEGSSMEPTLRAGDWILVRKCEPGWTLAWMFGQPHDAHELQNDDDDDDGPSETPATESPLPNQQQEQQQQQNVEMNKSKTNTLRKNDGPSTKRRFLSPLEVALLKSKVQHYERMMARVNHMSGGQPTGSSFAWFYHSTPVVVPGQVIVLKSPEHFAQRHIKRIVAVGGQWLQRPAQPSLLSMETKPLHHYGTEGHTRKQHPSWSSTHRRRPGSRLQLLPPYTLYIEGDHSPKSRDSRHYGPLSRNLLCGTAEAIVWPPRRWQRLAVAATPTVQGQPRAFWQ